MKNSKKLIIATIMLVFAFVAVVSSTYAWFTMQQEAEVTNLELQAATAGSDLQISLTGVDGSYGYSVSLAETKAKLLPVTYDLKDTKFYQLAIDTADGVNKNKFKYVEASAIAPGTAEKDGTKNNEGYLSFDLYFKTASTTALTLKLDTKALFAVGNEDPTDILGTLRIMFVPYTAEGADYSNAVIYEHLKDETSTFGTGDYFLDANKYIAYNAFTHTDYQFLNALSDGKYSLNDTFFSARKYTTNANYNVTEQYLTLGTIDNTAAKHFTVNIWLEGWDGDTTNKAALQKFITYLKFFG